MEGHILRSFPAFPCWDAQEFTSADFLAQKLREITLADIKLEDVVDVELLSEVDGSCESSFLCGREVADAQMCRCSARLPGAQVSCRDARCGAGSSD